MREGKWVGGRAPFGYKIVGRRLEVAEDDAQIVRRIFTLAVKRNSTVTIADRLNREGLRTRLGGQWRFNHVARLLHTTVYYTGEYVWGRKEQVTQQVPEIVNKDLWEKAQEALQLNRKDNPGNSKRDYLLRSLRKCGFCNRSMVGMAFGGQDRRAYRCTAKLKASLAPHCPSRYIPLEKIESLVWNQLSDWILRREDIERVLAESLREYEAQRQE